MVMNAFHGMCRLGRVVSDAGRRVLNPTLRRTLTSIQSKIMEGSNGERIIPSPYGEISSSDMLIHEHVWNKAEDRADKIALVISSIQLKHASLNMYIISTYLVLSAYPR